MRQRRRKYRSSSSEGKLKLRVALIWTGAAVGALFLALLIGNILGKAADGMPDGTSGGATELYKYKTDDLPPIDAHYLGLSGQTDETFVSSAEALSAGTKAVSLCLKSGAYPDYRSEVCYALTGNYGGSADLKTALSHLKGKGLYVSCFFGSSVAGAVGDYASDAATEYEAALILEAFDAGADEVILTGLPTDREGMARVSQVCRRVRESVKEAKLGAAVSYGSLSVCENVGYVIDTYLSFADVFCLDASVGGEESAVSSLEYYFKNYPIRLLISDSGSDDRAAKVTRLNELGIKNIQSVGRSPSGGGNVG